MTALETEKAETARETLIKAGFTISQRCCSRPSCFDFAARRDSNIIFIKVQHDIGNLSPSDSRELKTISECISASSLLIGEKARGKPLEDDTVYSRYNISAVTPKTFESIVLRKVYPLIRASPGGYYVEIDGEAVRKRRRELGLSIGEVAEMIGISRRTLYGYEKGMAKASVSAAYKLIWVLGVPVAKPVNVLEKTKMKRGRFLTTAKHVITKNKFLRKIFRKFAHHNVTMVSVRKAPFDFVIRVHEEKMKIIGGVSDGKEREVERRVEEILSVSNVVQAHPVFITNGKKPLNKDVSFIHSREISKIRKPEDLVTKI